MEPEVVIIVEDDGGRIENLLVALSSGDSVPSTIVCEARQVLLDSRGSRGYRFQGPIREGQQLVIISPPGLKSLDPIVEVIDRHILRPAICLLDMKLENGDLNRDAGRSPLPFSLAIRINELFSAGFGRLVVQASNVAGDDDVVLPGALILPNVAVKPRGAAAVVRKAFGAYRKRFCLHAVPEVAELLWVFWRGFQERWDEETGWPPFCHDILQNHERGLTKTLGEIAGFLGCASGEMNDSENGWNPAKGLFWVESGRSVEELRRVSSTALDAALKRLNIPASTSLDASCMGWRLPIKPGVLLLMGLRNLLASCAAEEGTCPSVELIGGESSRCFTGHIVLEFGERGGADLYRVYMERSGDGLSRPTEGTVSQAMWDFLRGCVDVRDCEARQHLAFCCEANLNLGLERAGTRLLATWTVQGSKLQR